MLRYACSNLFTNLGQARSKLALVGTLELGDLFAIHIEEELRNARYLESLTAISALLSIHSSKL